jgi:hypothetical protein
MIAFGWSRLADFADVMAWLVCSIPPQYALRELSSFVTDPVADQAPVAVRAQAR